MPKGQFKNPIARAKKISDNSKEGEWFICTVCPTQFWRKPFDIKNGNNKFCSKKCYFKWQKSRKKIQHNPVDKKGDKNPNWRGGIDPINKRIRASNEIKAWRLSVFERDKYTCQDCGLHGVYLHAHHKKPFATYPELRFDLSNGETLCKKCHSKKPKGKEIFLLGRTGM